VSVIALLDITLKADQLDEARAVVHETLAQTRAFAGNESVEVMVDAADPAHWVLVERWASMDADNAYREFRATPAGASELGKYLAAVPTLTKGLLDPAI
jgi:quinol monooxygenase YgiN